MRRARGVLLLSAVAACNGGPPASVAAAALATAQPVPSAAQLFSEGRQPVLTGWEAQPERLQAEACARCHRTVHAAWAGSMHAQAWSDPVFARAFEHEPQQWCRNCHAPLQAQQRGSVSPDEGINCVACHVRGGQILGAREREAERGVHAVRASVGFASEAACQGCHQFNFPLGLAEPIEYSAIPMQNTLGEWREAQAPACSECHQGAHAVRGPHDLEWLRQQVKAARWSTPTEDLVSLQLELRARGHAFPTGDNFHSFVLEVSAAPDFATPLVRRRYGRELGKGFLSDFVVSGRAVLRDQSLPAGSPGPTVTFERPATPRLHARLRFFQHDSVLEHVSSADVESALLVWSDTYELSQP